MQDVLSQLRGAAEPTRLRLLALCARGAWCVTELVAILGQSQPRLSRHLKLLVEGGLLTRTPEGANAWFQMAPEADLARHILARLPESDPLLAADRRAAARVKLPQLPGPKIKKSPKRKLRIKSKLPLHAFPAVTRKNDKNYSATNANACANARSLSNRKLKPENYKLRSL